MKCSSCDQDAVIKQGNQNLCEKHYRIGQMRQSARRNNKVVPTRAEIEGLLNKKMQCPDCGITMNWRSKDGRETVASLQHYRDGTFGVVCLSCNTRHASMPDDTYRDMPKDYKFCPLCKTQKHQSMFSFDNSRSCRMRIKSYCKTCSDEKTKQWRESNRDNYNEYQRQYRAKRKTNSIAS